MKFDMTKIYVNNYSVYIDYIFPSGLVIFYYDHVLISRPDRYIEVRDGKFSGKNHDVSNDILLIVMGEHFRKILTQKFYDKITKICSEKEKHVLNKIIDLYDLALITS